MQFADLQPEAVRLLKSECQAKAVFKIFSIKRFSRKFVKHTSKNLQQRPF